MKSEFLIIGGGIIGLSVAREIAGKRLGSVTLVERGLIGSEASHTAAGMLAAQAESDRGDQFLRFCIESRSLYPELADSLLEETGIDIGLERTGTLYLSFNHDDSLEIRKRFEWQRDAGLRVEFLSREEILKEESRLNPELLEGLFFADDWQVENRKLISALRESLRVRDVDVFEGCEVIGLETEGAGISVTTRGQKRYSNHAIVCAGAWTSQIRSDISLPEVKPIKGQILEFSPGADSVPGHVIYSPRGYLVPRRDGRVIAGSTMEDVGFDKTPTATAEEEIRGNCEEILPPLKGLDVTEHHVGLRPMGIRQLPYIGRPDPASNIIVASGHFRNGVLLAPMTAKRVMEFLTC